ncbi:glutamine synthetase family protein [Mesorhizobium sp. CO1-1-8]|uniref:glutamine synthetase family protein n=1 Tax=Mesorhizobium sp. CO1-1-8 TaxID=2876631 RepID=UPI001CD16FDE|nr:glutamine synthetase family protein [Mesorhizobium sp. CO1-1-8]MBZ9772487.1 glutamine synthetase [Mesorhizobium sp. CO1-1-8]
MHEKIRVENVAGVAEEIRSRGLPDVTFAHFDTNGTLRGKKISKESFLSALEGGLGLPSVFLATDHNEAVVPGLLLTDPKTGYQNGSIRIDPASMREFPQGTGRADLLFLTQFDDKHSLFCPRAILSEAIAKCEGLGWDVLSAFELEFSLLKETPATSAVKRADALEPFEDVAVFGSIVQQVYNSDLYDDLRLTSEVMGFPLDALHKELGPGLIEVALQPSSGIRSADNAALFKTMAKAIAKKRGLLATFIAKLKTTLQGHGAHVHLSMRDRKNGKPLFFDPDGEFGISPMTRHFLGGLQRYLPDFTLLALPNVNSYKRVIPDAWAPVYPNWGYENRTCAFRVVGGSSSSKRIEIRLAGADANPYLVLAAILTAGRLGVEQKLEPTEPCKLNGWASEEQPLQRFPASLSEAIDVFANSGPARDQFSEEFVAHLTGMKRAQNNDFLRSVTDWEVRNLLVSS